MLGVDRVDVAALTRERGKMFIRDRFFPVYLKVAIS